jgi:hypothetical protein
VRALLVATVALFTTGALRAAMAQQDDRWQITLDDGKIIWELHLVRFRGDTLVVQHADSTLRFPISRVDELRLVRKAERRQTAEANRYGGVLGGTDDEFYRLTLYSLPERREIVEQIFKDHPPAKSP